MPRCLFALTLLALTPALAKADAALDEGLQKLAARVADVVKEQGQTAITFGDFVAPPRLKATGGPGLAHQLALQFKALPKEKQVEVRDGAPLQLLAVFTARDEKENEKDEHEAVVLRITATILDKNDEELKKVAISVFGSAGLQFTGQTAELPPQANEADQQNGIRNRIEKPQAAIVGAETRAVADSQFGLEVRVANKPRVPELLDGRSFVKINRGEEYVVVLHNRASFEAAVELRIDGLSMFAFSTDGSFDSKVLVAPGKTVEIPGWYFTDKQTRAFVITSLPESAAGQRGMTAAIGTITASFSAAWEPTAARPADEAGSRDSDRNATGIGRPLTKNYVTVPRVLGRMRSVVSVRYNR